MHHNNGFGNLSVNRSKKEVTLRTKILLATISAFVFTWIFAINVGVATAGWHEWSQAARNQAIVNEANSYDDGDDGGQCKVWVQNVVYDASSGSVWPPTNADNCSWNYSPYVVGRSALLGSVAAGEIIQMQLSSSYGSGPHTLIVTGNNGSQITVKESNWCSGNCEEVGSRTLTYQQFYNMVDCYSVYYIL